MNRAAVRAIIITSTIIVAAVSMLGLILISPLALRSLDTAKGINWTRLSEIGQTYGAASAILSALAFGGIAVSLFIQTRQAKTQQIESVLGFQLELLRMTLENPEIYSPCWEPLPGVSTVQDMQRHVFTNLIMRYDWMAYEIGVVSESALRITIRDMFQAEVPRQYWERGRTIWAERNASGRRGRFARIVDEEYGKVIAEGRPPISGALKDGARPEARRRGRDWYTPAGTLAGLAGGVLIGAALRRQKPR